MYLKIEIENYFLFWTIDYIFILVKFKLVFSKNTKVKVANYINKTIISLVEYIKLYCIFLNLYIMLIMNIIILIIILLNFITNIN